MKNKKLIGIVLAVAGAVLLIGSLAVDMIGIGKAPGLGLFQIIGAVVGAMITAAGILLALRK